MKPLLTVPIKTGSLDSIERFLRAKLPYIDAYEIWLDALPKKELNPARIEELVRGWKKVTKKKLLIVCKEKAEKGSFSGTKHEKILLLIAAAKAGADYVDIDLQSAEKSIERLVKSKKRAKVIVSFHDFKKTPTAKRLSDLAEQMKRMGADIIKIATFVNTLEDNQNLFDLAFAMKRKKQKHIILGMGEKGIATRILGEKLGNEVQFVALEAETAPGQLSYEQAIQFQKVLE